MGAWGLDFRSLEETAYLMASPRNAQRLNQSMDALVVVK